MSAVQRSVLRAAPPCAQSRRALSGLLRKGKDALRDNSADDAVAAAREVCMLQQRCWNTLSLTSAAMPQGMPESMHASLLSEYQVCVVVRSSRRWRSQRSSWMSALRGPSSGCWRAA